MKTFIVKKNARGFFVECNDKVIKQNLTLQQLKDFLAKLKNEYPVSLILDGEHKFEKFNI